MPQKGNQHHPSKDQIDRDRLAQRLKEAREYLGLSQEYVAQQTRMPRPAISEIEAGRRRVESLELRRLASLYGRPLSYLLEEGADPAQQADTEVELKLRHTAKGLPSEDVEEVVRFAEYLRHKKQAEAGIRNAEHK